MAFPLDLTMDNSRPEMRCGVCNQFRPGRDWDTHSVCPLCRSCTRSNPCERCMSFSPARWAEIQSWLLGRQERLRGRLDAVPDPVVVAGPLGTSVPLRPVKAKAKSKGKGKEKAKGASAAKGSSVSGGGTSSSAALETARDSVASASGPGSVLRDVEPASKESTLPRATADVVAPRSDLPQVTRSTESSGSQAQALAPGDSAALRSRNPSGTPRGREVRSRSKDSAPGDRSVGPGASAPAGPRMGSEASASASDLQDTRERLPRLQERRRSSGSRERVGVCRDHRSRSPARSGSRHQSSGSGSPDSESDAGYRRDRRQRRTRTVSPDGFPDPTDPGWMSQLAGLLGPLIAGEVAKQTAHLLPSISVQEPVLPLPTLAEEAVTPGTAVEPPAPNSLELLASDEFDDEPEGAEEWTEETVPAETEEEDSSPRGTELPPTLLAAVTDIFCSKLGYEAPVRDEAGPSGSRLSATNEEVVSGPPEFPVDDLVKGRLETLAGKLIVDGLSGFTGKSCPCG